MDLSPAGDAGNLNPDIPELPQGPSPLSPAGCKATPPICQREEEEQRVERWAGRENRAASSAGGSGTGTKVFRGRKKGAEFIVGVLKEEDYWRWEVGRGAGRGGGAGGGGAAGSRLLILDL